MFAVCKIVIFSHLYNITEMQICNKYLTAMTERLKEKKYIQKILFNNFYRIVQIPQMPFFNNFSRHKNRDARWIRGNIFCNNSAD